MTLVVLVMLMEQEVRTVNGLVEGIMYYLNAIVDEQLSFHSCTMLPCGLF